MTRLSTALLALALAGTATAQEVPARLTLADALRLAELHNPALRRASNDAVVADWRVRQAWAAFLPSLNTSLGFSAGRSTRYIGEDDFGRPVESPTSLTTESSSARQGVSASVTLFDGGASLRNLRARRSDSRATEAAIEAQRLGVSAQVQRAFYQAMRAQQNIALEEQLLASARDRLERSEALLRLAAVDQVDVLGARADVASQEQRVAQVRGEAEKAKLAVLQSIGASPAGRFELAGDVPAAFDAAALPVDSLIGIALRRSPVLAQRAAQADAARQGAAAARGGRLPTISVSGDYGRNTSTTGYGALGEFNPRNSSAGVGLSVSLPLFNRFGSSVQIAQAHAAAEDAEQDARAARLQLEAEVRSAHIDLVNAFRSHQLAQQSAALSRDRLELAQEKFRLGATSFTELQNVIDRTAQAERSELEARFQFVSARIALEEKLGTRIER